MQKIAKQNPFSWAHILELKSPLVELFTGELRGVYWAENHLVRTLLKMKNASTWSELHLVLDELLARTKMHSTKLEHIFELMDEIIHARRGDAMAGLSVEAEEIIERTDEGTATRDLGIILVCEKILQNEIATYIGLIKLAYIIGREDVAELLGEILNDQTHCNELMNDLEETISQKATEEN